MAQKTLKIAKRIVKLDKQTGEIVWELVNPTNVKWSGTSETIDIRDGMGTLIESYEKDASAVLECTSAIVDIGVLADQNGTEVKVVKGGTGVKLVETHKVANQKIKTNYKAAGTVGNEIGFIYVIENGERVKSYAQSSSTSTDAFAYTPGSKEIDLPTGNVIPDGAMVQVVYSPTFTEYTEVERKTDNFTDTGYIFVDGFFRDACSKKDEPMQLTFPNGKISANFDYSFGEQAAVTNIKIDAMTDACGEGTALWKLTNYDLSKVQA